jgi:hypothetical protein
MSAKALLLVALAFAIIFILRLRQRLALLAEQVRGLRERALERITYRPAPKDALASVLDDVTAEAESLGLTMLGDHVEEAKLAALERPMRWFVDGAGTTFGWMAPFEVDGAKHTVIVLMSHELDSQTITARQPLASTLSRPPFVTLQHVAPATSFQQTLAKHRAKAGLEDSERAFIPVKTFEQICHELDRMRDKVIAWRTAQPAGELLDADLRSLLGSQYDKLAPAVKRRLG